MNIHTVHLFCGFFAILSLQLSINIQVASSSIVLKLSAPSLLLRKFGLTILCIDSWQEVSIVSFPVPSHAWNETRKYNLTYMVRDRYLYSMHNCQWVNIHDIYTWCIICLSMRHLILHYILESVCVFVHLCVILQECNLLHDVMDTSLSFTCMWTLALTFCASAVHHTRGEAGDKGVDVTFYGLQMAKTQG